ncbi:hypothetical protein A9977_05675 [Variovorax sp. UMC13]|nr:hypothetical protein [Variovorax sp. UMC13]
MELVHSDKTLSWEDRSFILEHYFEAQGQLNALAGAFFTPHGLARDLSIEVCCGSGRFSLVDLCAGIGMLSFACEHKDADITCVEFCEEYVSVGRRVVPSANWIHADVFTAELGRYDFAVSNPPFGAIKGDQFAGRYSGGQFEYKVIERASLVADHGVFILPQQSAPFRYSGERGYREEMTDKCRKFWQQTGIEMQPSCGIDTAYYIGDWKGVSPMCEVVCCDFTNTETMPKANGGSLVSAAEDSQAHQLGLDLFGESTTTRRQRLDRKAEVRRRARTAL